LKKREEEKQKDICEKCRNKFINENKGKEKLRKEDQLKMN
jgi:hypothetical protein